MSVTIGRSKISLLIFADDLVLLASSESGLQHALYGFAAASETEIPDRSRSPVQCFLQVGGVSLKQVEKFKYLGVAFTSNGKQDKELNILSGKSSAVMRALYHSIV